MKKKVLLLIFGDLILICIIIFFLSSIGAIEIPFLKNNKKTSISDISDDPFLLEQESLRKQWAVLTAKENDLQQRQDKFDQDSSQLVEKQKELNKQMDTLENKKDQMQESASVAAKNEASIRSIADKVNGVPPESGAAILNDMEPAAAAETIQMMDKIAKESGKSSTSAYLISLMDPAKRKEVVRLLTNYPTALGDLNTVPDPTAGAGKNDNDDNASAN